MIDPRFPELTLKQINSLKAFGTEEHFPTPTRVFSLGDTNYDFFVILKGCISITDAGREGKEVVEHTVNQFSGDSGMLSTRRALFHATTGADTTLLRIKPDRLKEAIAAHSDISDMLLNAFLLRDDTVLNEFEGGIKVVGREDSTSTYKVRDFMEKNHIWYTFIDLDKSEEAEEMLAHFDLCSIEDLPILIDSDGRVAVNPSLDKVARYTGVLMDFEDKVFDVLVIGAGPAGLAASVYAASEGLDVVTIDSSAPGGQAGKSSKIENYLGFPIGISGSDLANKAYIQAQKFGCNISIPHKAEKMEYTGTHYLVTASNDKVIKSRTVVAATGANYQQLPAKNLAKYEGIGVYYSATGMHAAQCKDSDIGVVGGGNSAGQAALFLADHARMVYVILRGNDLSAKMSDYLVQRIEACKNIEVLLHTNVTELKGNTHLETCILQTKDDHREVPISNLFTFIGAKPCSNWLNEGVETDQKGFISTGAGISPERIQASPAFKEREPFNYETSSCGFFAVGDVRKGSVKRVASAVGEGSVVVSEIHRYLALHRQTKQQTNSLQAEAKA
ncbi:MAG: FAD-dependent oxidoreductase [Flavobacteriales bacterium]